MDIWVGIDGSEESERALTWAIAFANGRSDVIRPVSCWHLPPVHLAIPALLPSAKTIDRATKAGATRLIDKVLANPLVGECSAVTVAEPHITNNPPAAALRKLAGDIDLIVVGNRGLGGIKGMVLGSVSGKLAATTKCPLVVVPSNWAPDSVDAPVVVGVDGSPASLAAARWADHWFPSDRLELVHAWTVPVLLAMDEIGHADTDFANAAKKTLVASGDALDDSENEHERIHLLLERGDARRILIDRSKSARLVVLGAQQHHGFARMVLGSTAQGVLQNIGCPTVVVPRMAHSGEGSTDEVASG